MPLLHLAIISALQGVTEFLPVSSSGHLVLLPFIIGIPDQGLTIDVAAHLGTLGAVLLYSRHEFMRVGLGLIDIASRRPFTPNARLSLCLMIASLPVALAGLAVTIAGFDAHLRSVAVIGWSTLIFGVLLYFADRGGKGGRQRESWTFVDALIMGLWQAAALIPGASRAGVTITGARFLGFSRTDAARLAMLMSAPAILGATLLSASTALTDPALLLDSAIVALIAFLAALLSLRAMLELLQRFSFAPYAFYRILLGAFLISISW